MNPFVDTLHLQMGRSACLGLISLFGHGMAAAVALWLAASTASAWSLLLVPIVVSALYSIVYPLPIWAPADGLFRWAADDRWYWRRRDGSSVEAECLDAQLLGTIAVRLRLREQTSGRRRTLLIFFDGVTAAAHRHLRARATLRGRGRTRARDG